MIGAGLLLIGFGLLLCYRFRVPRGEKVVAFRYRPCVGCGTMIAMPAISQFPVSEPFCSSWCAARDAKRKTEQ